MEFVIVRGEKTEMQEWEGRTAGHPSCSQNAHDKTVLVPCAKLKGNSAIPVRVRGKRTARSQTPLVGRAQLGDHTGRPLGMGE